MKHTNIYIIGVPEGEESNQEIKNLFKDIMTENSPILVKENNTQVQEVQRIPNELNPKRPTPRYNIIKMAKAKDKERIFKAATDSYLQRSPHKTGS